MRRSWPTHILVVAAIALTAVAITGCSLKKNTAGSRKYTAFITRYNIYYNGDTHYKETLSEMERTYEDDYTQMLHIHPVEAKADPKAPQPTGNFDRSIEKAQKAIQLRSIKKRPAKKAGKANDPAYKAWMKREEYNPFLHNAWMMMGRSQYFNGDFLGSASTFFYVSKHFGWLPATVTEAKLWQARAYLGMDWLFEAETILTRVKPEELTSKTLRSLYATTAADFYLRSADYEKAAPQLIESIRYARGPQKTRLRFLLGQVYARLGKKTEAYAAFKKAGSASNATYRTKFNARIKQSEVFTGDNIETEVKALKRMTRYDRNAEYLDQVYYAIGNLYLSRRDTLKAIENYKLAAEKSKRNGIDKAISQITLGQLYYARHEYDLAQPCFAEALPQLPENYPDYQLLKRRSDVLDELAVYSQNVTLQDSLLRLSAMSEEDRMKVINKIIDDLKKKEKEEAEAARREEYLADQAAKTNDLSSSTNAPQTFTLNTDDSWYFYNTASRNAGKTDFQKRWGSRKLEDDWRRRNKQSFDMSDFDSADDEDNAEGPEGRDNADGTPADGKEAKGDDKKAQEHDNDPHFPEYYLKQIPMTDQERATSNDVIQEGLYNMGVILKDKLEDFPASISEFDRLLSRYPDNVYRLDTYYNLYLIYVRQGDQAQAERYRQLIITDFADSQYGQAMRDPAYLDNLRAMDAQQEGMYENAYEDYLANRNDKVHQAYTEMRAKYPLSKLMPKFMFINALAYVTERRDDEFKSTLRELLELYPQSDVSPLASNYLKQLASGRELKASATNNRGMLWDLRLSADSTTVAADTPAEFELNPADQQLLVLLYPTDSVSANQLLYDIARHNFSTFVVKDFDLEQMNFGRLGMLIIKGFTDMNELNHYRRVMADDRDLKLSPQVRPVIISARNFDTLLKEGRSFEEYFRYLDEQNYREAQENVLPAEVFGPAETLQEAEQATKERLENHDGSEIPDSDSGPAETDGSETTEKPAAKPADKPSKPAEKPTKPADKEVKPAEKPAAKPATLPEYPDGSEGDDPLFDNP